MFYDVIAEANLLLPISDSRSAPSPSSIRKPNSTAECTHVTQFGNDYVVFVVVVVISKYISSSFCPIKSILYFQSEIKTKNNYDNDGLFLDWWNWIFLSINKLVVFNSIIIALDRRSQCAACRVRFCFFLFSAEAIQELQVAFNWIAAAEFLTIIIRRKPVAVFFSCVRLQNILSVR